MPAAHPRTPIQRDPEVERALERTRACLPASDTRSTAAHLRALVLRGAEQVVQEADDPVEAERQRLIEKYNMIPAKRPIRWGEHLFPWLDEQEIDPDDPTPATDALNWARGKDRDYG
ncbi:MAG TPA: hypothetical protein VGV40_09655 [Solirubrobacteraceae bacterium]|nr:hypothetical protein [Solirubrobacteraceae bacterium]